MCNCIHPAKPHKCMSCFMELYKAIEKYCGVDNSYAYEGLALEHELFVEDELDELIPDEIYNCKDSWT